MIRTSLFVTDLDGVICDLATSLTGFLTSNGYSVEPEDIVQENIIGAIAIREPDVWDVYDRFWHEEIPSKALVLPGARSALCEVIKTHVVVILTSRHLTAFHMTQSWLALNGLPYDALVCGTDKAQWLESQVNGGNHVSLFVDDFVSKVHKARKFVPTVLVNRPWNQGYIRVPRVDSLAEAVAAVYA